MSQFVVRLVAGDLPFLMDVNRMWGNICMIMHSNIVSSCSCPQLLHPSSLHGALSCMSLLCISASTHSHPGWSIHVDESANATELYRRAAKSVFSAAPLCPHHQSILITSGPRRLIGVQLLQVRRILCVLICRADKPYTRCNLTSSATQCAARPALQADR